MNGDSMLEVLEERKISSKNVVKLDKQRVELVRTQPWFAKFTKLLVNILVK